MMIGKREQMMISRPGDGWRGLGKGPGIKETRPFPRAYITISLFSSCFHHYLIILPSFSSSSFHIYPLHCSSFSSSCFRCFRRFLQQKPGKWFSLKSPKPKTAQKWSGRSPKPAQQWFRAEAPKWLRTKAETQVKTLGQN